MHNPSNIPQATSSLEMWLSYLTDLHSQAIDMGLERVGEVARKMGLVNFNQSTPTGQGKTKLLL